MFTTKISYLAVAGLALSLAACETYPVRTDVNAKLGVSGCRNFGWIEAQRGEGRRVGAFDNPVNDQRLHDAVAANLASRGIPLAQAGTAPDCLVGHAIGSRNVVSDTGSPWSVGFGYGYGWGRRSMFGIGWDSGVDVYREGRISVDLFDAKSREPIWHGTVQLDVGRLTGKDAQMRIDAAVKALFAKFPAGGTQSG